MDIRDKVHSLINETSMTSVDIIEHLGISYGHFYSMVNRAEIEARDARILVYDLVGHDGSDDRDRCAMCSIIMLREYSQLPPGWGEFQRERGSVCAACLADLVSLLPRPMKALTTAGCAYCDNKRAGIYFMQAGAPGLVRPDPNQAVPLCDNHRRKLDEKEKDSLLRDFYDRVDTDRLFDILGWNPDCIGEPMPIWDWVCGTCHYRYMPGDMPLVDAGRQPSICDLPDCDRRGVCCPECCPLMV